jgi:D-3-phosphoglycerate dehydrogenase / 2-oxoglutarate reductase
MPNVLIGSAPLRNTPGPYRDTLTRSGFTPIDVPGNHTLTQADLRQTLPDTDAMLAGSESLTAELLALAPRLRVIARTGVGYDSVDVAYATARRIVVTTTPGTNHESVAEQTFALLLALLRRVVLNDQSTRAGGWDRTIVVPARGKTLGLVGMGRIGRAVALRGLAFGMRVIAFDTLTDAEFDARHGVERRSLDELLAQADVVSLHLPLTAATRGMINRQTLGRMKPGSYLLNTARGGLVVEADLSQSLESGHLAGAGLDVFEDEPPRPENPLLRLSNVVVSPHMAGADTRSMADMAEKAAECVVALHQGHWPTECIVNGELASGWRW